ncbi:hypothetical protein AB7V66_22115 [Providencia rettgeri]
MIHKIIGGKTKMRQRNIKNSISYLLREKKPDEQEFIKILSGSKNELISFNNLITSKNLKSPYVAGVLSFEEENTEEEKKYKIISEFEEMIFSGIPEEYRPPILWVEHRDKGRLELNYLTFNSLATGRSFPVFYDKTDRRLFNDFSEIINYQHGFSSPFDDFTETQKIRMVEPAGKTVPAPKKALVESLNSRLCSLILERKITNKAELIEYLKEKECFKINRVSKNTISIITDIDNTPIRLKGDIYQDGRDFGDYFKERQAKPERSQSIINEKLANYKPSYKKGLQARAERNKRVYIDPIIRRQQKIEQLNKLIIKREKKPDEVTHGVTILKEKTYDNKRQSTPSPASEIFNKIERVREQQQEINKQQQEINKQQQYINSECKKSNNRTIEYRDDVKRFSGRFGFFRNYINRFSCFLDEKLRSVIEFVAEAERKREEKREQKQEVRQQKTAIERRSRFRR